VVRNNGPSGLNRAQAQKLTAKPMVATASIRPGLRSGPGFCRPGGPLVSIPFTGPRFGGGWSRPSLTSILTLQSHSQS
jgi:hypothetical protein